MNQEKARIIVSRYNPEKDPKEHQQEYSVPFFKGGTVLDMLLYIRQHIDSTLAFNYECRYGHCGSCAIEVNGDPALACRTQAQKVMILKPLSNLPILRDLVVDRSSLLGELSRIRPFLERQKYSEKTPEKLLPTRFSTFRVVSRCIDCLCCNAVCPSYSEAKQIFAGPNLMTKIARFAFDPRDKGDRVRIASEEGLFNCAMCGKCTEVCPYTIDIRKLVMTPFRKSSLARSIGPSNKFNEIERLVKSTGKAFARPAKASYIEKIAVAEKRKKSENPVGLFLGCAIDFDHRLHGVAQSTVKLLEANEMDVIIPKNQVCCGLPFILNGNTEFVKNSLVKRNLDTFREFTKTVTTCPGCTSTLRNWYPQLSKEIGENNSFRVYDINELLMEQGLKTKKMKELNLKVTYHDPCHLKRDIGISIEPRELIQKIPGITYVEMDEADRCCGGDLKMYNSKLGYKIARRKARLIKKLNVDIVATACPRCITQISSALSLEGARRIQVLHMTQLLEMAYRLK